MKTIYTAPSGKQYSAALIERVWDETCGLKGEWLCYIEFFYAPGQKMTTWTLDSAIETRLRPVRPEAIEALVEVER